MVIGSQSRADAQLGPVLRLPEERYVELAAVFRALGDVSRAKIVYALMGREHCVGELAKSVGLSDSATSQHLRILAALRLVKRRRAGKQVFYSLDDQHIVDLLRVCLEHLSH